MSENNKDAPRPEGLDLARAAAKAAAEGPTGPATRKRPQPQRRTTPRNRAAMSSGAHPSDRDPHLLATQMEALIANNGWELDLKVQGVFGRWAELVGQEVADHCTPESFADSKLLVRTDSTAWATQLRLLAPTIIQRLNVELGHGTVSIIEIAGPHLPTWKKGRLSSRDGRGPRDTYG